MKKTLYISSNDERFSCPMVDDTLEKALQYNKYIAKVYIEIPAELQETIAEVLPTPSLEKYPTP